MPADLHTHTTFSDGSLQIKALPRLAAAAGLTHLAISDHDTFAAAKYCMRQKIQDGVSLIPAVELTCEDKQRMQQVHILCYYPDITSELCDYFTQMAARRNNATAQSMQSLEKLYPAFRRADTLPYAKDSGVTFKAHIMRVLMDYGYADCVYGTLFKQLFGKGAPCLVNPEYNEVYDMLAMAHRAKGVVVLAHPTVYNSMPLCEQLAQKGLIDGVEIEHPRNSSQDKKALYDLAGQYNLIITGGTDFHGINTKQPVSIGSCQTSDTELNKIIKLAKMRKGEK